MVRIQILLMFLRTCVLTVKRIFCYVLTSMNSQGFPDTNFILLESDEFVKEGVLTLFPYYIPTLDMHVQDASEIRRQHLSR